MENQSNRDPPGPSSSSYSPASRNHGGHSLLRPVRPPAPETLRSAPRGQGGPSLLRPVRPPAPGSLYSTVPRSLRTCLLARTTRPSVAGPSTSYSSVPRGPGGRSLLLPVRPPPPEPSTSSPKPGERGHLQPIHSPAPGPSTSYSSSPRGHGGRSLLLPVRPPAPVPSVRGLLAHECSGSQPPRRPVPRLSPLKRPDVIRRANTITFHKTFGSIGNRGELVWNRGSPALPSIPNIQDGSKTTAGTGGTSCELPHQQVKPATKDYLSSFPDHSGIGTVSFPLSKNKSKAFIAEKGQTTRPKEEASKPVTNAKKRKSPHIEYHYNSQNAIEYDSTTLDTDNDESGMTVHEPIDVQYCPECKKSIKDPHFLYEHMRRTHKTFICLYCLKMFPFKNGLLAHFITVHEKYVNPNRWKGHLKQVSKAIESPTPGPSHELSSQQAATTSTGPLPTSSGGSRNGQVGDETQTSNINEDDSIKSGNSSELLERIIEILRETASKGDTVDTDENIELKEKESESVTEGINTTSPINNSTGQVIGSTDNDVTAKTSGSKTDGSEHKIDTDPDGQPTQNVFLCNDCRVHLTEYYNLFKHFREVHSQCICLYCLRVYMDATSLTDHLESAHKLQKLNVQSWEEFLRNFNCPYSVLCCTCGEYMEYNVDVTE